MRENNIYIVCRGVLQHKIDGSTSNIERSRSDSLLRHLDFSGSIIRYVDYDSVECLKNLLKVYDKIEHLARKGYPDCLDLYTDMRIAFSKLKRSEAEQIFESISSADEDKLENAARILQQVLAGHR